MTTDSEWKEGKMDGHGIATGGGAKFVGEWKDGKEWQGTTFDTEGNISATYSVGIETVNSSTASSSSDDPESWCVRSSGVTKERFQRCVNSGGLQSYRGKADALAAYNRLRSGSSTSYASSSQSTTTASLTIRSNVRGDRVYIDGKYKGSTRLDLDLPKGRHTIRIEKEGYRTHEEQIDLKNALTLRASLEKISKRPIQRLLETNKCRGCDLTGADLEGADLTGVDLIGADLTGANLQNAKLGAADLRDANLMNANFHMARFCNTTMPDGSKENSDCGNDEGGS